MAKATWIITPDYSKKREAPNYSFSSKKTRFVSNTVLSKIEENDEPVNQPTATSLITDGVITGVILSNEDDGNAGTPPLADSKVNHNALPASIKMMFANCNSSHAI